MAITIIIMMLNPVYNWTSGHTVPSLEASIPGTEFEL
jgi:hypothetical protein